MTNRKPTPGQMIKLANKRRIAYRSLFVDDKGRISGQAEVFLADLKKFCRGGFESTFVKDDPYGRQSALLEGRREVWNRICLYLGLTEEDIRYLKEQLPAAD